MEEKKKEQIKQIKVLLVVLFIVIVIAIVLNVVRDNGETEGLQTEQNSNTTNSGSKDSEEPTVNGVTKDEVEAMKGLMDEDTYNEYMETFEAIENGTTLPDPENIVSEDNKMTEEEVDSLFTEADENGEFYYYTLPDGTETDIKIYNVTLEEY